MIAYGTMIAIRETGGPRFIAHAYSTPNSRTGPTITMFQNLLAELPDDGRALAPPPGRRMLVIQFDDRNHHDVKSVAYCRPRGAAPAVQLVPDTYFFHNRGYQGLREATASGAFPVWQERLDVVFWRGTATHAGALVDGANLEQVEQIPRVALCRKLSREKAADAAIFKPWESDFSADKMMDYLVKEGIFRPGIPMLQHGNYRYLIDIDGVANAWSFFEKLLLGTCILKVGSPFEQWFYGQLREWQHYVPVRTDLIDLLTQLEWCREHPRQACEIACEGQRFALEHSFERARRQALAAIGRSLIWLSE
jgi:hypothetical protein